MTIAYLIAAFMGLCGAVYVAAALIFAMFEDGAE